MRPNGFLSQQRVSEQVRRGTRVETFAGPPRTMPVVTRSGATLGARVYEPEGAIHGNVLIHGATACPQRFYAGFARSLTAGGLRVISYDYEGVGASRTALLRDCEVSMAEWAQVDARAMHRYVREHWPEVPLAVVGHSFGAQMVGLIDDIREADAALFVGAQLGYCGHWPQPRATALRALWKLVVPMLTAALGYLPGQVGIGEDLPRRVANQWARWCAHPDYLVSEFPGARARYARFDIPVLAYHFSDDAYAPVRAAEALFRLLPVTSITRRRLSPRDLGVSSIGHFGFFRSGVGSELWPEARDFLLLHLGALSPAVRPAASA